MKCAIFIALALLLEIYGWQQGVKESQDAVKPVLKKFPEPTYKEGETIWEAFYTQVENLKNLTISQSTILSSNAVSILETLSLLSKAGKTPTNVLYQLKKVYPAKASCYRNVVTKLNTFIGTLEINIVSSIDKVAQAILSCLDQFESRYLQRKQYRCERIDFQSLVRSMRLNANVIAFIADVAVNDTYAVGTYDTIAIISLISNLMLLSVHGTNANMGTVLILEESDISPTLRTCFDELDPMVADITKAIADASFENVEGIKDYLKNFTKIIVSYNPSLEKVLGPFEGVGFTSATVKKSLKK